MIKINKKIILGLGTVAAVAAPVSTVIACGSSDDSAGNLKSEIDKYLKDHEGELSPKLVEDIKDCTTREDFEFQRSLAETELKNKSYKSIVNFLMDQKLANLDDLSHLAIDLLGQVSSDSFGSMTSVADTLKSFIGPIDLVADIMKNGLVPALGSTPQEFDNTFNKTLAPLLGSDTFDINSPAMGLVKGLLYGFHGDIEHYGSLGDLLPENMDDLTDLLAPSEKQEHLNVKKLLNAILKNGFSGTVLSDKRVMIVGMVLPNYLQAQSPQEIKDKDALYGVIDYGADANLRFQDGNFNEITDSTELASLRAKAAAGSDLIMSNGKEAYKISAPTHGVIDKLLNEGLFSLNKEDIRLLLQIVNGLSGFLGMDMVKDMLPTEGLIAKLLPVLTNIFNKYNVAEKEALGKGVDGPATILVDKLLHHGLVDITKDEWNTITMPLVKEEIKDKIQSQLKAQAQDAELVAKLSWDPSTNKWNVTGYSSQFTTEQIAKPLGLPEDTATIQKALADAQARIDADDALYKANNKVAEALFKLFNSEIGDWTFGDIQELVKFIKQLSTPPSTATPAAGATPASSVQDGILDMLPPMVTAVLDAVNAFDKTRTLRSMTDTIVSAVSGLL